MIPRAGQQRYTGSTLAIKPAMEQDILAEINQLLGEAYDPAEPEITEEWIRVYRGDTEEETSRPAMPPPPARQERAGAPITTVLRVGTVIQRSDAINRRKQASLLETPPPPPARPRRLTTEPPPKKPTLEPLRVMGPLPPPPIPVEVAPGVVTMHPDGASFPADDPPMPPNRPTVRRGE
ncbi:hypothetical protein PUN28_012880 [Cardiocondyla obscurior]|uniref:Uncharacterized protein n=1 Tax=Cardiocondyla obscurior TaxID=286306 RepID=A0AAW2F5G0_9HYME